MAALCDELTAVCPSGYPCEFSYIHAKEKDHCHCNLLPGSVNGPETMRGNTMTILAQMECALKEF